MLNYCPAAASHAVCCVPHASTDKPGALEPALNALAHWLCCTSHERTSASCLELKVALPSTANDDPTCVTGGGTTPPRFPVNVCRFVPVDAVELVVATAAELAVAVASPVTVTVDATQAVSLAVGLAAAEVVVVAATVEAVEAAADDADEPDEPPTADELAPKGTVLA